MKNFKNILFIICLFSKLIIAQTTNELGFPTITNFSQKDFQGSKGILDIGQNEYGLMYFLNHHSLLEYDGIKWRSINLPNDGEAYAFSIGDYNRIYVGTNNDLGYFEPNETGALEFVSLKMHLPENLQNFIKVSSSAYFNGKVYFEIFQTIGRKSLFVWDTINKTLNQIETEEKWFQLSPLDDALYLFVYDIGIGKLIDDTFSLIKGGELLKNENIIGIHAYPDEPERLLISTANNGFYIYDGKEFTTEKWHIDYLIQDDYFMNTGVLPNGNIIAGTLNSGVLLFNLKGELIQTFNKANGLLSNSIYSIFIDHSGGLWIGGVFGISYLDLNAPIKWLNQRGKLEGDEFYITIHHNSLYVNNYLSGLYRLPPGAAEFENISVPSVTTSELFKTKDELFYSTNTNFLFEKNGKFKSVIQTLTGYYSAVKIFDIITSSYQPDRYYIGTYRGLKVIRKEKGKWIDEGLIGDDRTQIYSLAEEPDGSLWAVTNSNLTRIYFNHDENGAINLKDYSIELFDETPELKIDYRLTPLSFNGKTVFATNEGVFHYDESNKRFVPDSTSALGRHFQNFPVADNDVKFLNQDIQGNYWLTTRTNRSISLGIPDSNGNIEWVTEPFNRITGLGASNPYMNDNDIVWFSTFKGLLQFDLKKALTPSPDYPALIRKVTAGEDSLIFYGGTPVLKAKEPLSYAYNKLRFEFSASSYSESNNLRFSTFLEGSDKNWTGFTSEAFKEFTNLAPGTYTFWVKTLDINGKESMAASFSFEILPPWWKTWWAYSLFASIIILIVLLLIRWRTATLQKEKEKLEAKVIMRTTELQQSLENLKSTQSQLIQSEKMASLGELTAGIAHEIQNPLNFVNNFSELSNELIDEMNEELDKGEIKEAKAISIDIKQNLEKINHHGKRADGIVKGMLQHSRSSSSEKELTDINKLTDEYLRLAYHGLRAKDKSFNATLITNFDESLGNIEIVPQDIGRVILNLITNAFYAVTEKKKQQPENYEPTVSVSTKKSNNNVLITVEDNGNGIPKAIIDKIFQPFFTTKPTGQGTGLGLSLSYDIVKAHGGTLKVETQEGTGQHNAQSGTRFTIEITTK